MTENESYLLIWPKLSLNSRRLVIFCISCFTPDYCISLDSDFGLSASEFEKVIDELDDLGLLVEDPTSKDKYLLKREFRDYVSEMVK